MKISIIGAGFTGLSAAFELSQAGHTVSVFEKDTKPGGLALGYQEKGWKWTVEQHYHHWFTNDDAVLRLAEEISYPIVIKRPKTSVYIEGKIYQLDSPFHVLTFSRLTPSERLRMAATLGLLRYNPFWKPLERFNTHKTLKFLMGERPFQLLWDPQLKNKFGKYEKDISLAWFWARIKKRTADLAYPEGGYLRFAQTLQKTIEKNKGSFYFASSVAQINTRNGKVQLLCNIHKNVQKEEFDRVIVTVPSFLFAKLAPDLPSSYVQKLTSLKGLGAMNMVLRLKKQFLKDGTYWLSICDTKAPMMAIINHTNFIERNHYNSEHIVYVGNYVDPTGKLYSYSDKDVFKHHRTYLNKLQPGFEKDLIGYRVFRVPFAQPIIPVNYSKMIPSLQTPLPNVYLANMQQVYPWDRGTNYAVELGKKVADVIMKVN